MGKKKQQGEKRTPQPEAPVRRAPSLLAGQLTVPSVVALVAIALVIGVSGGYLAHRFTGPSSPPPAAPPSAARPASDPSAMWQTRLLQNPRDVEALMAIAHAHLTQNQPGEAEALYKRVLAIEPKNVEAIDYLGEIMQGRGQADAALRQYEAALTIQLDYIDALWDKASLLQRVKKDYPAAIKTWEAFQRSVGAGSQDYQTAERFIAEARQAMGAAAPPPKGPGGRP